MYIDRVEKYKLLEEEYGGKILATMRKHGAIHWTAAFNQVENVIICESISDALTKISSIDSILSQEMLH